LVHFKGIVTGDFEVPVCFFVSFDRSKVARSIADPDEYCRWPLTVFNADLEHFFLILVFLNRKAKQFFMNAVIAYLLHNYTSVLNLVEIIKTCLTIASTIEHFWGFRTGYRDA
jgi:hypothetical protein